MIVITKAKHIKKDDAIEINYTKVAEDGRESKGSETFSHSPHKALKEALRSLRIHLAVLTSFVNPNEVEIALPDEKQMENFHVTGFSLGGGEDTPGVIITGHKILSRGKTLTLNSPFERWDMPDESKYVFIDDLRVKITHLDNCLHDYVMGATDDAKQLAIFDEPKKEGESADTAN